MSILEQAAAIVSDRGEDYGDPRDNHTRTAAMWSAYRGVEFTAEDVCMFNILQKASRAACILTDDTLLDIVGYCRNLEILREDGSPDRPSGREPECPNCDSKGWFLREDGQRELCEECRT